MRTARRLLATVLVLSAIAACSSSEPEPAAGPGPTPAPNAQLAGIAETCREAEPNELQAVERVLADGYTLGPATVAAHPEGQLLIADVLEDEERVSSADAWLLDLPSAVPVTSSAEEYSTVPRPPGGASVAGDAGALALDYDGCYTGSP